MVALIIGYINFSFSQRLPYEMRFSQDGKRLVSGANITTGFYDESIVREIEFNFSQPNYWTLLTNNYNSGTDILATVTIDGVSYDSVGVRFKGQTSYRRNNTQKKSFNITMNYMIPGQDVMGYETLNLNCGYEDPSSLREVLFNHLGRNYTPGLKSNFATLKINGQNWGPYGNIQQLNAEYLKEWFLSSDGTRWRAVRPGAFGGGPGGPGGPFGTGFSTLNYNGPDSTDYNNFYTLKKTHKADPWEDLIVTVDKLNNLPLNQLVDSLKSVLDVDKALWFLAHEIIFTDEDSYIWKGGMDYYVYWEAETGRVIPLEYDGNSCFLLNATNWSPFYHENDTDFPLMNRLFAVPELRQRYLAHLRTILDTYMNPAYTHPKIDAYVAILDSLIIDDPKKIYSHSAFTSEVADIKNLIVNRRSYLQNHSEVNVTGLDIQSVSYPGNPVSGTSVDITANISGASGVDHVYLYYGSGFVGAFDKIEMFDDGNHNDGAAGDGEFGGQIPAFGTGEYVRYYIEAIADNAAKTATYEPKGAEHDIYIYRVSLEKIDSDVVINELMASNDTAVADSDNEFDDWMELYNKGTQTIDLSGYFLTDTYNNLTKWEIPQGTMIAPNEYLIIWADEDSAQAGLHADFKLSAEAEELILLTPDTLVADEISWEDHPTDLGFARVPNGTGNFVFQTPTFGLDNSGTTDIEDIKEESSFQLYPNPASQLVFLKIPDWKPGEEIRVFNTQGQLILQQSGNQEMEINVSTWAKGLYFVQYKGDVKRLIVGK